MWFVAALAAATVAQYWRTPARPGWAELSWLLPLAVLMGFVFKALWELVGSGHHSGHADKAKQKRAQQRRPPRDPKAHLLELRRSREHWAVMLRLPPDGACEAAQRHRWEAYDPYRAPPLPMPDCDAARCRCGYSGLKERRRRDVLPAGLERDRRAGAVVTYRPTILLDREPAPGGTSLPEVLRP